MFSLYFYECGPSQCKTYVLTVQLVYIIKRASFSTLNRIGKYESGAFLILGYFRIVQYTFKAYVSEEILN